MMNEFVKVYMNMYGKMSGNWCVDAALFHFEPLNVRLFIERQS